MPSDLPLRNGESVRILQGRQRACRGVGLKGCNDLIHRVVTFLYKIVGNEKATVCFQSVALKYRVSNNLLQDTENFRDRQIILKSIKGNKIR